MKRVYKFLGIVALACCSFSAIITAPLSPAMTQSVSAAKSINGITRPMAERWAWWYFYTSHNGEIPNGPEKIAINNQNFRVVSWWTRNSRMIVVKIMRHSPGLRDTDYQVYRVSSAGNLKLRNDAQSFGSGTTVWDTVSNKYHSLNTDDPAQQINSMSPEDLKYKTITPMETAAAILIYYDKVQGGDFVAKGLQENGFNMSQTKVSKKNLDHLGRGIAYGLKPINDNVQEYFYTVGSNGKVYMYVNENRHPFKTVKLQTIIKYINNTKQQQKVKKIAGMFHVEDVKPVH